MKKSFLLWMGVVLMMVVCMSSCSSDDDDYSYVQEFGDNNNKENIIGTWHLLHYSTGWGIKEDYEAGEVTVTFTKNGELQVINKRDDQHPFSTGNMAYYFVDIEKSIFTGEPRTCISFGYFFTYSYTFDKGFLYLSQEAYDGDGYTFQKLK
jgi:protein involved in sex pheromone biosynthesis